MSKQIFGQKWIILWKKWCKKVMEQECQDMVQDVVKPCSNDHKSVMGLCQNALRSSVLRCSVSTTEPNRKQISRGYVCRRRVDWGTQPLRIVYHCNFLI